MKEIDFSHSNNTITIESPGIINIIGEHTDYNNGFVLPTAIDKKIRFKFKRNNSLANCNDFSKNFEVFVFCVSNAYFKKFNKKSIIYQAMPREISIRINN